MKAFLMVAALCSLALRGGAAEPVRVDLPLGAKTATALTHDDIESVLDQLGYQVTSKRDDAGRWAEVDAKRDKRTFRLSINLSADGRSMIWLSARLKKLTDLDRVPAERWLALLQAGQGLGGSSLCVDKRTKQIVIQRGLANEGAGRDELQREIGRLIDDAIRSSSVWDINWDDAAPVRPALMPKETPPFVSKAGRFRVRFPEKPTENESSDTVNGKTVSVRTFEVKLKNGDEIGIAYVDQPNLTEEQAAGQFDRTRAILAQTLPNGSVVAEKDIKVAGFPGRNITLENDSVVGHARLIVVDNRLYILVATHRKGTNQSNEAKEFFDTFQLTK